MNLLYTCVMAVLILLLVCIFVALLTTIISDIWLAKKEEFFRKQIRMFGEILKKAADISQKKAEENKND